MQGRYKPKTIKKLGQSSWFLSSCLSQETIMASFSEMTGAWDAEGEKLKGKRHM